MTLRPYTLDAADEARPERLLEMDADGVTRCEAMRRLLSASDERRNYAPATWWRRLVALLRVWL